jgi:inhibitor of cysteine peptidase
MEKASTTLTEADDGRTVTVRAGDTILLRLHENPTTGYRWAFDVLDSALVDAPKGRYQRRTDAVGAGGDLQWVLTAKAPGSTRVALKLWRQWEGDTSIQKRFGVTVTIRP